LIARFARQLRERDGWTLSQCTDDALTALRERLPEMGRDVAIDASDLPAYANGHKSEDGTANFSDPDASWGHRSAVSTHAKGGFYGFKIDAAVDVATGAARRVGHSHRQARRAELRDPADREGQGRGSLDHGRWRDENRRISPAGRNPAERLRSQGQTVERLTSGERRCRHLRDGFRQLPIVICASCGWLPFPRRERFVAESAAAAGHEVVFVEHALDVRALARSASRRDWLERLRGQATEVEPRIRILPQSTLLPGHRSWPAQRLDAVRLAASLRRIATISSSIVVATQPWQWPAVAATPAARRVFDCGDDWASLIPSREPAMRSLCRRIGQDADAVIVVNPRLANLFGGSNVHVVANGTTDKLLDTPIRPVPSDQRMVYAGTLTERFDAPFLMDVLRHLPEWSAELYGECLYPRQGSAPGVQLQLALSAFPDRLRWHGPVHRAKLVEVLNSGRVLIAPHRASLCKGQDSMKLYDYAARGRPIVATSGGLGDSARVAAAGAVEAETPAEFAAAVRDAAHDELSRATLRRAWAERNRWELRWPAWVGAVAYSASVG
jgi:glycosyltransferase involved in cell wall biosynthesis